LSFLRKLPATVYHLVRSNARADLTRQHSSSRTSDLAPRIRNRCPHRRDLDFAFDQLLPISESMQIPQSKNTPIKVIGYFARHKRKVNDSGQAIEEAIAESSEKSPLLSSF
jgi:hypothetical protein